jgi:hypothetical protein
MRPRHLGNEITITDFNADFSKPKASDSLVTSSIHLVRFRLFGCKDISEGEW